MDFVKRNFPMPTSTTVVRSSEELFFDKDGHLEFAPNDPENPKNYSFGRKYSPPSQSPCDDLHVSAEAAGLVTPLFLLGYCAGPLFWAPLSEFYGRRWIFYVSFTIYLAIGFLCTFTPNFAGLLVGRFLTGTAVSAALTNAPGILADIWGPVERGNAMILFATMKFAGPALGPVVSGFVQLKKTWRWTFYILLWMAGAIELLLVTLPETLPMMVLRNKACRLRKIPGNETVKAPIETSDRSLGGIFTVALTRPWRLLIDPINFFVSIYYAVVYTLLYMLFRIYPIVFQQRRGWNAGVGELPLIGTVIGACLGGLGLFVNSQVKQKKFTGARKSVPEDRLPGAMVGGVMFAVTIFWFAWTAEYNSVHWAVPTVAETFLATSILLIFVVFINYIIDSYLMYVASAVAANTVLRSACAAASPLFTQYMFDVLGVGGAGSLIGGIGVLLIPIPFVFYRYGAVIRARSKFTPTDEVPFPPVDEEKAINGRSASQTSGNEGEPVDNITGGTKQ
ncbi:Major facilitator superfamily domain, general substrate transporter [Penicillium expansum]|uniref:Major facilitator superfamily domain, general substrate transporter n=1 Tax=Penicillium expansum TaxID=27334 RepID=A0A0A2JVV0_PENEN|nr:Major facilitator superfamily domain, general substrate transporter [Penicillium expansum]KGO59539.1 Major facilitator superfamily domain, general substrate transporter [Penicillium expansum]